MVKTLASRKTDVQHGYNRDAGVFSNLLLRSIFLCYQGNMLMTDHVWALHWNWLWARVVSFNHSCRVAHTGVINGIWIDIKDLLKLF